MEFDWQKWQSDIGLSALAFGRAFWLLDRDGIPYCEVRGWIDHDMADSALDVAEGNLTIFADNEVVPWLLHQEATGGIAKEAPDFEAVFHDAVHMIVQDANGTRWGYRVHELQLEVGGKHGGTLQISGLRPLEHYKHIVLKANPQSADAFQLKWSDIRQGQSLRVLKEYVIKNLERDMQDLGLFGAWDVAAPSAWANIDPDRWRIFMNPYVPAKPTVWTVLEARYDNAWDMLNKTATAAGLMMTAEYWFPGDPQPAPNYVQLRQPTIVLDVVDRSMHRGAVGNLRDPLRTIHRKFTAPGDGELDDFIEFDENANATASGLKPWVVWKPNEYQAISRLVLKKSTDWKHTIGGRSPAALNFVVATGLKAVVAGLASLFPVIGPAVGEFIKGGIDEVVKDRILDFMSVENHRREAWHGRFAYREVSMPGEAYSISGVQAGVAAMEASGGSLSFEIAVVDDAPFRLHRDYRVGDQVGVELLGMLLSSFVSEVHLIGNRGKQAVTVGIGDPRLRESQARMLSQNLEVISGILSRLKTYAGL